MNTNIFNSIRIWKIVAISIILAFGLSNEMVYSQSNAEKYYRKAIECTNNKKKQAKLFEKAAELGHDVSQFRTGLCYYTGQGVPKNKTIAVGWFLKAGEQGYRNAFFYLGQSYEYGEGIETDLKESMKWYLKDAKEDTLSLSSLSRIAGKLYPDRNVCFQEAVNQQKEGNFTLFAALAQSAAERGLPKAQLVIGDCYSKGIGVQKDNYKAYLWMEKAEKQGVHGASEEIHRLCDRWSDELQIAYTSYNESVEKYERMSLGYAKKRLLKEIDKERERIEKEVTIVNEYYKRYIANLTTEAPTKNIDNQCSQVSSKQDKIVKIQNVEGIPKGSYIVIQKNTNKPSDINKIFIYVPFGGNKHREIPLTKGIKLEEVIYKNGDRDTTYTTIEKSAIFRNTDNKILTITGNQEIHPSVYKYLMSNFKDIIPLKKETIKSKSLSRYEEKIEDSPLYYLFY